MANVKAEADEGYVLKKYEVKAGDANKKADLNADDVSDSYEQAIFMDENKTVDVEFEKSSEGDTGVLMRQRKQQMKMSAMIVLMMRLRTIVSRRYGCK